MRRKREQVSRGLKWLFNDTFDQVQECTQCLRSKLWCPRSAGLAFKVGASCGYSFTGTSTARSHVSKI